MEQVKKTEQGAALATILVVDDEELVRQFLHEILTMQGYRVLTAQDGVAALDIYKRQFRGIDLVLTDLVMPAMHGEELLDIMRILNPALKAIIMSGYYGKADLAEECLVNVVGMLSKPFSLEQLHGLLAKALYERPFAPHFLVDEVEAAEEEGGCQSRASMNWK